MPLTGPIPEGRPFFCPHCGALYSVTDSPLPKGDNTTAKCVVCTQTMVEWGSSADSGDYGQGFRLNATMHSDRRRPPVPTKAAGVWLPA